MIEAPWLNLAIAIGVGLMIGLERERSKGVGSARRPAGIRTFTLAALLGAIAAHLGGVPLLAVATAGVTALSALSYVRGHDDDPGLTTEIGLIATPLLGGLAMSDTGLAAGLGVAIAVIFAAKAPLHGFVDARPDRRRDHGRPRLRSGYPGHLAATPRSLFGAVPGVEPAQHLVPGHSRDGARGMRARRDTGARRSLRAADRRPCLRLRLEHGDNRRHGRPSGQGPGEHDGGGCGRRLFRPSRPSFNWLSCS